MGEYEKLNLYCFENNGSFYTYDSNSGIFIESTKLFNDILKLSPKNDYIEIKQKLKNLYNKDDVEIEIDKLNDMVNKGNFASAAVNNTQKFQPSKNDWDNGKILKNMLMSISYCCNLNCIYCFAEGGNYGRTEKKMTKEIAQNCIDYWFKFLQKDSKKIKVSFTGGEPLVNKEILIFSVNYINKLLNNINQKADYQITTNATIMDEEIVRLFKENDFYVLISIDGNELIQNKNRPLKQGGDTFKIVENNLKSLIEHNISISARITLIHDDVPYLKESVVELWKMGFTEIAFGVVFTQNEKLQLTKDDIHILDEQLLILSELTYENLNSKNNKNKVLLNLIKYSEYMHQNKIYNECSYTNNCTLMFSSDGEIYNCDKYIGNKEECVGDVKNGVSWSKCTKGLNSNMKNLQCDSCWVKRICGYGCIYEKSFGKYSSILCEAKKSMVKASFILYTNLYKNNIEMFNSIYNDRRI